MVSSDEVVIDVLFSSEIFNYELLSELMNSDEIFVNWVRINCFVYVMLMLFLVVLVNVVVGIFVYFFWLFFLLDNFLYSY